MRRCGVMPRAWQFGGRVTTTPSPPPSSAEFPLSEEASAGAMMTRIDELRAAGSALDAALIGAHRFVKRASRRAPERLVLVVDDDDDTRALYATVLRACGFHVQVAENGEEALAQAASLEPDIIVMDYSMPVMNGGAAAQRLARDERTRHIPVLLLSAFPDEIPRDVRLGCAAFLAKPCPPEDLGDLLHLIIAARHPAPGT